MADRDELKRAAAERAVEFVESGMVLGLGTGSTAAFFVEALAARVGQDLSVIAIPTSERALPSTGRSIWQSMAPTKCSASASI